MMLAQDFDISGSWDPMIPDAEIISLLCTLLTKLDVGEFTVKVCCQCILVLPEHLFYSLLNS
jgi:histidyl-tRNA synthetase